MQITSLTVNKLLAHLKQDTVDKGSIFDKRILANLEASKGALPSAFKLLVVGALVEWLKKPTTQRYLKRVNLNWGYSEASEDVKALIQEILKHKNLTWFGEVVGLTVQKENPRDIILSDVYNKYTFLTRDQRERLADFVKTLLP